MNTIQEYFGKASLEELYRMRDTIYDYWESMDNPADWESTDCEKAIDIINNVIRDRGQTMVMHITTLDDVNTQT